MEKYGTYRTEDFLLDNRFLDWVCFPNEAANEYWKTVFILYPECEQQADEARKIVSALTVKPSEKMPTEMRQQILHYIAHHTDEAMPTKKTANAVMRSWGAYVAAACLLICCGVIFIQKQRQATVQTNHLVIEQVAVLNPKKKITNTAGEPLLFSLPDTSTVILAPNAQITYDEQTFATHREIHLSGEAFFEVTSQKGNPFRVNTDYLTATVLGTSFRINAAETLAQSKVTVQSGVVAVRKQPKNNPIAKPEDPVYLTANQEIGYSETASEQSTSSAIPNSTPPVTFDEHFRSTPLQTVLKALSNQYQIAISVTDSTLQKRTITASLQDMHLFEKLDLISKAAEATYNIVDGRVTFVQRAQEN